MQVDSANKYGLNTEQSATFYVVMAWLMGTDFDTEFKSVHLVLNSKELDAPSKEKRLKEWMNNSFTLLEGR